MNATPYAEWAQRWATGMALSAPYQREMASAARAVQIANRRKVTATRCAIKGCRNSGCRRGLCTKHYQLVPYSLRAQKMAACIAAEMRESRRWDRKFIQVAKELAA